MRTADFGNFKRPGFFLAVLLSAVAVINCGAPGDLTRVTPVKPEGRGNQNNSDHLNQESFEVDDSPLSPHELLISDASPQRLICRRAPGSNLVGEMTYISIKGPIKIGRFTQNGNVGACEMSRRAARNNVACLETSGGYKATKLDDQSTVKSFGKISDCLAYTQAQGSSLSSNAKVQFIDNRELSAYLKHLPNLADKQLNEVLHSEETIWYDEDSMVFVYQDSFGNPTGPEGLRANRVAYDVGSTAAEPDIKALTEYFELQTFKFPFSITAGRLDRGNSEAIYFWQPPRDASGNYIPVAWWKSGSHWHWVFPAGTIMGELLLVRDNSSASEWYVHEVRTRVREINHWRTDIFRPFPRATDFAASIKKHRSNWQNTDLKALVAHLEDNTTLTPAKLDTKSYAKAVPSFNGYYDKLPATKDHALIRSLLKKTVFKSAMNTEWKRSGDKVTYAPATDASFHIVPKHHIAGLLENTEKSCVQCHNRTGQPLGQLDKRAVLYGEIWGEDQVFTWHPFKPITEIYSVSDGSRVVHPQLQGAGLLLQKKPAANDPVYRELPKAYSPVYK
jgi:phenylpropionate dioxygenase-like ring-hydroxylating dioxygenase large terminal subunit